MIEKNKPLAGYTTIGIGGPAEFFAEVSTVEQMKEAFQFAKEQEIPIHILGKGSNTLFDDRGFKGLVILNKIDAMEEIEPGLFEVGAGCSFPLFGVRTAKKGYTGFEFAAGIPASVGGAIYMNAGASGQETSTFLAKVTFLDKTRGLLEFTRDDLHFDYRFSSFQKWDGAILSAQFRLPKKEGAREKQIAIIEARTKSQPYEDKSAGCVFRNPPQKPAGQLIDELGLKGSAIGGAMVSPKHANFIVNKGGATAKEILSLVAAIEEAVHKQTGIHLEREIRTIFYDPLCRPPLP